MNKYLMTLIGAALLGCETPAPRPAEPIIIPPEVRVEDPNTNLLDEQEELRKLYSEHAILRTLENIKNPITLYEWANLVRTATCPEHLFSLIGYPSEKELVGDDLVMTWTCEDGIAQLTVPAEAFKNYLPTEEE